MLSEQSQNRSAFWRRWLLALTTVALIGASCASNEEPSADVEPTMTAPTMTASTISPTTDTTAAPIPVDRALADVFFLRDEILVPVPREVDWEGMVTNTVEALMVGPTGGETDLGLGTALEPSIDVNDVVVVDGLATVDLSPNFGSADGTSHMVARLAQVVFTTTQFPEIDAVSFALDGRPVTELPGEGIDLSRPLDRSDYRHLLAGDPVPAPDPKPKPDPDPPAPQPPTWSNDDLAGLDGDHGSWLATVTLVRSNDVLNVRKGAGTKHSIVGKLEPGTRVLATGATAAVGASTWVQIETPIGAFWVNGYYLAPDADGFTTDDRIDKIMHDLSAAIMERSDLRSVASRRGLYVSYNGHVDRYSRHELRTVLRNSDTRIWPVPDGINPGPAQTFAEAVGDRFVAAFAHPDSEILPNEWDSRERNQPIPFRLRGFNHVGIHPPDSNGTGWEAWYVSFDYENGQPRVVGLTVDSWTP